MSIFGQVVGAIFGASIGRTASRSIYPISTCRTVSDAWFRLPSDNSSKRHSIRFSDRTGPACELVSARKAERAYRTLQNYQCELNPSARWFGTANREGNAAMLQINRALGYQSAERWYDYEFPSTG